MFRPMVEDSRMPRPRLINSRRVWAMDELDAAFKNLPERAEEHTENGAPKGIRTPVFAVKGHCQRLSLSTVVQATLLI